MEFALNVGNLIAVLPIMGYGMLGIFIVTGVIIGVVSLLNTFFSR